MPLQNSTSTPQDADGGPLQLLLLFAHSGPDISELTSEALWEDRIGKYLMASFPVLPCELSHSYKEIARG